jgi:hypothetical protein
VIPLYLVNEPTSIREAKLDIAPISMAKVAVVEI